MKKLNLCLIILILIVIFFIILLGQYNLIFIDENKKQELLNCLNLDKDIKSFTPLSFHKERTDLGSFKNKKVVKFLISKDDYNLCNLDYLTNNDMPLIDKSSKKDKGEFYECEISMSKQNIKYNYDDINPSSNFCNILSIVLKSICIILVIFLFAYNNKKYKYLNGGNMKKIIIYFTIAICIIGCCFLFWYFSLYLFEKDLKQHENEYMTTEQSKGDNLNTEPSSVGQLNTEAGKDERIMLADMLKEENEIVITEDNVDNSNKIIEKANLKKGIFIVESSREKFLEIINTATENTYSINNEGYLMKPSNESKSSDLTQKINNYIDSENLIIINISSTYKGMLNDGIMLDFMIERTMYVQTFKYNDNIKIALVNPDRINEKSEDLTQKEIYEEVLLGL